MAEKRKKNRELVLLEEINGKLDAIQENVKDIPKMNDRLTRLEDDMEEVKSDVFVIKGVVNETNQDVKRHDVDIAKLKTKA